MLPTESNEESLGLWKFPCQSGKAWTRPPARPRVKVSRTPPPTLYQRRGHFWTDSRFEQGADARPCAARPRGEGEVGKNTQVIHSVSDNYLLAMVLTCACTTRESRLMPGGSTMVYIKIGTSRGISPNHDTIPSSDKYFPQTPFATRILSCNYKTLFKYKTMKKTRK